MKSAIVAAAGLFLAFAVHAQLMLSLVAVPEDRSEHIAKSDSELFAAFQRGPSLAVGEAFQALQFVLEGDSWRTPQTPLGHALMGGKTVKRGGRPWFPTLVLAPGEVEATAQALSALTQRDLQRMYNPIELDRASVDPKGWEEKGILGFNYVAVHLEPLKQFYARAAHEGASVLVAITIGPLSGEPIPSRVQRNAP